MTIRITGKTTWARHRAPGFQKSIDVNVKRSAELPDELTEIVNRRIEYVEIEFAVGHPEGDKHALVHIDREQLLMLAVTLPQLAAMLKDQRWSS